MKTLFDISKQQTVEKPTEQNRITTTEMWTINKCLYSNIVQPAI